MSLWDGTGLFTVTAPSRKAARMFLGLAEGQLDFAPPGRFPPQTAKVKRGRGSRLGEFKVTAATTPKKRRKR